MVYICYVNDYPSQQYLRELCHITTIRGKNVQAYSERGVSVKLHASSTGRRVPDDCTVAAVTFNENSALPKARTHPPARSHPVPPHIHPGEPWRHPWQGQLVRC